MRRTRTRNTLIACSTLLLLAGCRDVASEVAPEYEPGTVEEIKGSDLSRVVLTEDAARRIGLETTEVEAEDGGGRLVVPASAIWIDEHGDAWVYTNPEPLVFVRAQVEVAKYIGNTAAVLSDGPEPGTEVASVGVAELIGTEFGV
jgi:hypothetical protein